MLQCILIGVAVLAAAVTLLALPQYTVNLVTRGYEQYWPLSWRPPLGARHFQLMFVALAAVGYAVCLAVQGAFGFCI